MEVLNRVTGELVSFEKGDKVIYLSKWLGVVNSDYTVTLNDGTVLKSLLTQAHKYKKYELTS